MSLRDLNWRKGFFRLWLLASSIWVIVLMVAASKNFSKHDLLFDLGITFLPPVIALVFGIGFMWAFSGFVPKQDKVRRVDARRIGEA